MPSLTPDPLAGRVTGRPVRLPLRPRLKKEFSIFEIVLKSFSMSHAYKIHKQEATYFLTLQVVNWIDIFTREKYRIVVTDSLNYCVTKKELTVFAEGRISSLQESKIISSKSSVRVSNIPITCSPINGSP